MMKHTPWRAKYDGRSYVIEAELAPVADLHINTDFWEYEEGREYGVSRAMSEATACKIVCAVNSHDALVDALRGALLDMRYAANAMNAKGDIAGASEVESKIRQAKAALQLAEGR